MPPQGVRQLPRPRLWCLAAPANPPANSVPPLRYCTRPGAGGVLKKREETRGGELKADAHLRGPEQAPGRDVIKAIEDSHSFLGASYHCCFLSPPAATPAQDRLSLLESPTPALSTPSTSTTALGTPSSTMRPAGRTFDS
ncbi:hypothetical protein FPV67DRAFT_1678913 [Lyophyllum atratum]|nr:hypothetical protein FPV67DRAFT_1678913 [Lyophyllum atratum]